MAWLGRVAAAGEERADARGRGEKLENENDKNTEKVKDDKMLFRMMEALSAVVGAWRGVAWRGRRECPRAMFLLRTISERIIFQLLL